MRRSILAATAALLMATAANAGGQISTTLYQEPKSYWRTDYGKGHEGAPMCIMTANFRLNSGIGNFYVKSAGNGVFVHIYKDNWRMDNAELSVQVRLRDDDTDHTTEFTSDAVGVGKFVEFHLEADNLQPFLKAFGDAELMQIYFPDGDEHGWQIKMDGSRKATEAFLRCIDTRLTAATQPNAKGKATQPSGKSKATQPNRRDV